MRILFADKFEADQFDRIVSLGHECISRPELTADELPDAIGGFDALIVRSTVVSESTIAASDRLALIVRAGAGTNTIDLAAAAARGIYVCNTPGKNAIAVAELTLGLIISIDRAIPDAVMDLRSGRWDKSRYSRARGLYGRHLGIVGLGEVGTAVAERAAAFGLELLSLDRPHRRPQVREAISRHRIGLLPGLDELAAASDILTFPVPGAPETKGIISEQLLGRMKPGAMVINTSRGDLVDEAALIVAMDERGIRAGLDVYPDEPASGSGEYRSVLATHPNVYGTHHIGASTAQAQEAVAEEVVRIITAFDRGRVENCVNMETRELGAATVVVRHLDKVGVLSDVLSILRNARVNVEQMTNEVFAGGRAACATIRAAGDITGELVAEIDRLPDVIQATVRNDPPPPGSSR